MMLLSMRNGHLSPSLTPLIMTHNVPKFYAVLMASSWVIIILWTCPSNVQLDP